MEISYTITATLDDDPINLQSFELSARLLTDVNKSKMTSVDRVKLFTEIITEINSFVTAKNEIPVSISSNVVS